MARKKNSNREDFWGSPEIELLEMDMKEVSDTLMFLRPSTSVMLWGGPGIGKTRIAEAVAAKRYPAKVNKAGKVVTPAAICNTIITSTYEPTDLGGVPFPVNTKEGATEYLRYLVAQWAYNASVESGNTEPMFLFLDDLATAHEQVQAACYRLMLEREVGDLHLRDNVHLLAAGNRPDDNAATHDMPTPLGNRMLHLYCRANPDSWLKWAVNEGDIHPLLVGYIRTHMQNLYNFRPDAAEKAFATPRSLELLSNTLYDLESAGMTGDGFNGLRFKLGAGICGHGWAHEFFQWVKVAQHCISPLDIVKDPEGCKLPKSLDIAHATVASAEKYLINNPEAWKPMLAYSCRIEHELGLLLAFQVSETVLYKLSDEEREEASTDPNLSKMFAEMGDLMTR